MTSARRHIANEFDTVEVVTDLPDFGIKQGERGVVIDVYLEPEEAYDLEFVDQEGKSSKFAYGIHPKYISNIDVIAKNHYTKGIALLNEGNHLAASREFRQAIELTPSYIRGLHESLRVSFADSKDFGRFIWALFFIRQLDPNYVIARNNLAIAYLNWGVEEAKQANFPQALQLFHSALRVKSPTDVISKIKENISLVHSNFGLHAHKEKEFVRAVLHFETAFSYLINERTRQDLSISYVNLADHYMETREYENAIYTYLKAEDTGLISAAVYNNHAVALATTGVLDEAAMLFESALQLEPNDEFIRKNLLSLQLKEAVWHVATKQPDLNFNPLPTLQQYGYQPAM